MRLHGTNIVCVFLFAAIILFPKCVTAGVSDGQPVNAATTNAAFLDKNTDTTALGKVNLNNASDPSNSGSEIFNSQREFNSLSSFTGKPINQSITYTPSWSNNDVGSSSDNVKTRADNITAKFNSSTGHTHTGAAGDAPPIAATSLSGTLGVAHGGTGQTSLTNHGVLIGAGTSGINQLSAAGAGTVLGGVASSNPAFTATPVLGSSGTTGTLGLTGTSSGVVTISPQSSAGTWSFIFPTTGGTTGQPLLSGGGSNMTWGTLGAAVGGTGVVSPTAHSVCFGEGASAMTCTTGAAGTILNAVSGDPQWTSNPQIGALGVATGAMTFDGFSSGAVTIQAQAAAGTYNFNLPITAGSSGQPLLSGGGSGTAQTYGTLGVGAGGTGQTSFTDGQLLIGNTTGNTLTPATLTAGSNVTITNGHGTITIAASTGGLTSPAVQTFTSTGTQTGWLFTISTSTTLAVGDTYTNNGHTYTAQGALSAQSGQVLWMSGTGATSGTTLTRSSGSGTSSITFSATAATATYTPGGAPLYIRCQAAGGGGAGGQGNNTGTGGSGGTTWLGPSAAGSGSILQLAGGVGGFYYNSGTGCGAGAGNGAGGAGGSATISGSGVSTVMSRNGDTGWNCVNGNTTDTAYGWTGAGASTPFCQGGMPVSGIVAAGTANNNSGGTGGCGGAGGSPVGQLGGGGGGGGGAYADVIISGASLLSSYPYIIGGAGAAVTVGGTGAFGAAGGSGKMVCTVYTQ